MLLGFTVNVCGNGYTVSPYLFSKNNCSWSFGRCTRDNSCRIDIPKTWFPTIETKIIWWGSLIFKIGYVQVYLNANNWFVWLKWNNTKSQSNNSRFRIDSFFLLCIQHEQTAKEFINWKHYIIWFVIETPHFVLFNELLILLGKTLPRDITTNNE